MASDTATASPRPIPAAGAGVHDDTRLIGRPTGWPLGSRLGRLIFGLNMLSLAILIGGALILNELRQGLVNARLESLAIEGEVIANVIDQYATLGEPEPRLEADAASNVLQSLFIPITQRARLYDASGRLLADSRVVADRVDATALPPARETGARVFSLELGRLTPTIRADQARAALAGEVFRARAGTPVMNMRLAEDGRRVVSVSLPIQHVRAVVGVLTLEAGDVQQIISAQRRALVPFIVIAIGVSVLSWLLLTQLVAEPVFRLARAADKVRLAGARAIALPDLAARRDELGDLARALADMTQAQSQRMEHIERFAADVAHELRNPMTSIRSAVETLGLVKDEKPRTRLMNILAQDISRMERLITDISNASRLDAELSRETPRPVDLARLSSDICALYNATIKADQPTVKYTSPPGAESFRVSGREGPFGQVIRNLVDNARSFSAPGGEVRVILRREGAEVMLTVDDDGPGMPPENLETVFERFYTSRPKGAAFGGNSGLGLAIARQIIEKHGGRLWAENRMRDGQVAGARFTIALRSE